MTALHRLKQLLLYLEQFEEPTYLDISIIGCECRSWTRKTIANKISSRHFIFSSEEEWNRVLPICNRFDMSLQYNVIPNELIAKQYFMQDQKGCTY